MNILKILLNKRKIVKDHIFYYTGGENIIGDPKMRNKYGAKTNLDFSLLIILNPCYRF